jgi:hypothetical protein
VAALEGPEFEANRNSLGSFGSANALLSTVAPEQEDARVAAAGSSLMSDPLTRPREASKDLGEPTSLATGYSNDGNGALGESEDLFVNTSSSIRRGSGPTISVGVAPQFSTGSLDEALGPPVKEPRSAPPLKMKRARTLSNAHSHVPLTTGGTTGDGTAPPAPKMVARSVGAGLWPYVRQQIFLGIAASSVPVKHDGHAGCKHAPNPHAQTEHASYHETLNGVQEKHAAGTNSRQQSRQTEFRRVMVFL